MYFVIKKYNLKKFEVGRNKYVEQILIHGFIPNYYLDEFFEYFLYKEFHDILYLSFDYEEIENEIKKIKKDHNKHNILSKELSQKTKKKNTLVNDIEEIKVTLDNYTDLKVLRSLYEKKDNSDLIKRIMEKPIEFLQIKEEKLEKLKKERSNINNKINSLKKQKEKKEALNNEINKLNIEKEEIDEYIIDKDREIENISNEIFKVHQDDNYKGKIMKISSKKLNEIIIKEKENKVSNKNNIFLNLLLYIKEMLRKIRGSNSKFYKDFKNELQGLPIKESLLKNNKNIIHEKLKNLKNILKEKENYKNKLKSKKEKLDKLKQNISNLPSLDIIKGKIDSYDDKIENIYEKIKNQEKKIKEYKMDLTLISDGEHYEKGLNILKKQFNINQEINSIEKNINITEEKLNYYINKVKTNKKNLEDNLEKKIKELESIKNDIKSIRSQIEMYPERLNRLIESTRSLIFQCDGTITKFIYNSLRCLKNIAQDNNQKLSDINIQPRIKKLMRNWWENFDNKYEFEEGGDKQYIRSPYISCEDYVKGITLNWPAQELSNNNIKNAYLKIVDETNNLEIFNKDLKLYINSENKVEIESQKIKNIRPKTEINVIFSYGIGNKLNWKFEKREVYFFNSNKKLIDNDEIKFNSCYMIIPKKYKISPYSIIKFEEDLKGAWYGYKYYSLGLKEVEMFKLLINDITERIYRKDQEIKPHLSGGVISNNLETNDNMVYLEKLPSLEFSIDNIKLLRLWEVKIARNKKVKTYDLGKNKKKIIINNKIVEIILEKFIKNNYGEYNIILTKRSQNQSYEFQFSYIPDIDIKFSKEFYPLLNLNKDKVGYLTIDKRDKSKLKSIKFKNINKKEENKYYFDLKKNSLKGELKFVNNIKVEFELNLPVLEWKIRSNEKGFYDEWSRMLEDLWYEGILEKEDIYFQIRTQNIDINSLNIKASAGEDNNNNIQKVKANKKNKNIYEFNFLQFSDLIRELNFEVIIFEMNIDNKKIYYPLLKVILLWAVYNLENKQNIEKNKRVLELTWKEKGKCKNKTVNLWNLKENSLVFSKVIEVEQRCLFIKEDIEKLKWGRYRIEFKEPNIWSDKREKLPKKDQENVFDLIIGDQNEIIDLIKKDGAIITRVEDKEEIFELDGYKLENVKLAPDFPGEERYKGNLVAKNNLEVIEKDVTFYIKVEDEIYLPFMVDRDRDGLEYCHKCNELFYDIRNKHKDYHYVPTKIYLTVED